MRLCALAPEVFLDPPADPPAYAPALTLLGRPFGCLGPTLGVQNAAQSCEIRVFDAPLSQSAFWTTLGTP